MAPHSSTLAWKIPWTEEPGRLQSVGSLRIGHDWATSLSLFTFMHWRRKWQPTPVFLPGESQGWRGLGAAVYGVAQSRTRLKRLSSSNILNKFHSVTVIIHFDAEINPNLSSGNPFKLVSGSSWHDPIILWPLVCLFLEQVRFFQADVFSASVLKSNTYLTRLGFFHWRRTVRIHDLSTRSIHWW